jgi:hypothetical protein
MERRGKMRKALITTGVILLFLVVTSLQSFAQETEICVCIDKKGNMKFSESGQCAPRLSLLCWPGGGAVHVYDSSDPPQYLGILLSLAPEQPGGDYHIAEIFIPSLNIATIITENQTPRGTGNIIIANVLFGSTGCSDDPYLRRDTYRTGILYRCLTRYFYSIPPLVSSSVLTLSYLAAGPPGGCTDISTNYSAVSEAIELQDVEIPFTLPVNLPLSYESQ